MQLSLFYNYESICRSSSFFQKFETFFLAVEAVTAEKTLRKGMGVWVMDRSVSLRL